MSYPDSSNQGSYPVDPKTGWFIQPTKSPEQQRADDLKKAQEAQAAAEAQKKASRSSGGFTY
jgi:hypothetical protein